MHKPSLQVFVIDQLMVYKCLNITREIQEVSPRTLRQPKENTSMQNETELDHLHQRHTHTFRHTA